MPRRGGGSSQVFAIPAAAASSSSSALPLLTQSDFTYLGFYDFAQGFAGWDTSSVTQGLTYRYKAGQLYLLCFAYMGNAAQFSWQLTEFQMLGTNGQPNVSGGASGGTITSATNFWTDVFNGSLMNQFGSATHCGCWIPPGAANPLWTTWAHDYNDTPVVNALTNSNNTLSIMVRNLVDGNPGSITNFKGPWGLANTTDAAIYGGMCNIPSWFVNKYNTGPYGIGWGGYASTMAARISPVSLGPWMAAIQDPSVLGLANGTNLSAAQFKTMLDYSSGTLNFDWYTNKDSNTHYNTGPEVLGGIHLAMDRGVRNTSYSSTLDFNSSSQGPFFWNPPAPDALGRWPWNDTVNGTGMWIRGANKEGIVFITNHMTGTILYSSQFTSGGANQEIQIYDPDVLGAVINGSQEPWFAYPASRSIIPAVDVAGITYGANGTGGPPGRIMGACWDSTTNKVYMISNENVNTPFGTPRLYVWSVAA